MVVVVVVVVVVGVGVGSYHGVAAERTARNLYTYACMHVSMFVGFQCYDDLGNRWRRPAYIKAPELGMSAPKSTHHRC